VARGEHDRLTLAVVTVVATLVGGAGFALGTGDSKAAPAAARDDTTPEPPTTAPTPDPAPVPPPKPPKPAPKPAPKPHVTHSTPAPAPSPTPTTTPAPSYTPPATTTHVTTRHTRHKPARHHRRRHTKKAVLHGIQPRPAATVLPFAGGPIAATPAAVTTAANAEKNPATILLLSGMVAALVLIVVATWMPATRWSATAAGRMAIDHKMDLVITGIATFLITLVVYAIAH
jgi:hypothetical protein